ncbi:MAG: glycoside hydrolase family 3 N-terminal domain-containing protein, partial [Streptosporangiaceae bacterium]
MLSTRTVLALSLGAAALTAGCAQQEVKPRPPQAAQPLREPVTEPRVALATEVLRGLTVRQKVGQLLVPAVTDKAGGLRLIKRYGVGGVAYPSGRLVDAARTARLSQALQKASPLPLLISADTTAGPSYPTLFPGPMALAATHDPVLVRAAATVAAAELNAAGINQDRTPLAGPAAEPALAGRLLGASLDGYHAAGVITTVRARLDAPPSPAALAHGADSVLSAAAPKPALAGLLRGRLGFRGVITAPGGTVQALLAGADQLLMPPDLPGTFRSVLAAVRDGRITAARLDDS